MMCHAVSRCGTPSDINAHQPASKHAQSTSGAGKTNMRTPETPDYGQWSETRSRVELKREIPAKQPRLTLMASKVLLFVSWKTRKNANLVQWMGWRFKSSIFEQNCEWSKRLMRNCGERETDSFGGKSLTPDSSREMCRASNSPDDIKHKRMFILNLLMRKKKIDHHFPHVSI